MALDFPSSPNINDTYTFGGVTWTYDGTTWKVLGRFQSTSSPASGTAPTSATSTGTAGQIAYDADYIYICIATDTWKRAPISTWT